MSLIVAAPSEVYRMFSGLTSRCTWHVETKVKSCSSPYVKVPAMHDVLLVQVAHREHDLREELLRVGLGEGADL